MEPLLRRLGIVAAVSLSLCANVYAEKVSKKPAALSSDLQQSVELLIQQTDKHMELWGIDTAVEWSVEQERGLLYWRLDDDSYAIADVQIIATYSPENNSLLWAWRHPDIDRDLTRDSLVLRTYGRTNQIDDLRQPRIYTTEDKVWAYTALASQLNNAMGAYRGRTDGPWVYMTFHNLRFSPNAP